MLNTAESDNFYTFKGGETSVSFIGRVSDRAATALTKSPALEEASKAFAAIAEERLDPTTGNIGDRLAAMRKLLNKSRDTAEGLGEEALGLAPQPRGKAIGGDENIIALAAMRAEQKFGTPSSASMDGCPKPIVTPAQIAKAADKQIV